MSSTGVARSVQPSRFLVKPNQINPLRMHTKSRKVIPVANVEFRVKLVLAAVILSFLPWVTNGRAEDRLTRIGLDWAYYNPLAWC
jgi:hypothetical protein